MDMAMFGLMASVFVLAIAASAVILKEAGND